MSQSLQPSACRFHMSSWVLVIVVTLLSTALDTEDEFRLLLIRPLGRLNEGVHDAAKAVLQLALGSAQGFPHEREADGAVRRRVHWEHISLRGSAPCFQGGAPL